jgi:hypothetical protein
VISWLPTVVLNCIPWGCMFYSFLPL